MFCCSLKNAHVQVWSGEVLSDKARACNWAVEGGGGVESFRKGKEEEGETESQRETRQRMERRWRKRKMSQNHVAWTSHK